MFSLSPWRHAQRAACLFVAHRARLAFADAFRLGRVQRCPMSKTYQPGPETDAIIANQVTKGQFDSPDDVVRAAVRLLGEHETAREIFRRQLEHDMCVPRPRRSAADRLARMLEISERSAQRPVIDPRTPDDILGYDETGLPH
jgi:putative addiction module CopG family antidote